MGSLKVLVDGQWQSVVRTPQPVISAPGGRLTFSSGVPLPTTDISPGTTVYYTPYVSDQITLWDGAKWARTTFTQLSLPMTGQTGALVYDVFMALVGGTPTLERVAWATFNTRFASGPYATLMPTQNGVRVKSTNGTAIDATRRYLGSYFALTTTTSEDSAKLRLLYNVDNRRPRIVRIVEPAGSWTSVGGGTLRYVNGNTLNYVYVMQGVAEDPVEMSALLAATGNVAMPGAYFATAIGLNGTVSYVPQFVHMHSYAWSGMAASARFEAKFVPTVGINYYTWIEITGTTNLTILGSQSAPTYNQSGLLGTMWG